MSAPVSPQHVIAFWTSNQSQISHTLALIALFMPIITQSTAHDRMTCHPPLRDTISAKRQQTVAMAYKGLQRLAIESLDDTHCHTLSALCRCSADVHQEVSANSQSDALSTNTALSRTNHNAMIKVV